MATGARRARATTGGSSQRRRALLRALAIAGVVGLSLLGTACGGSSTNSKVAQIGQATTTTSSAISTKSGKMEAMVKYAACIRKHGVPTFADPDSSGSVVLGRGPAFEAANRICQKLLPNGGQMSPQEQAQHLHELLAYAVCMRTHGVTKFPDPYTASDGIPDFPAMTGVDPNSPQFKSAQKACQKLPGSPKD
jgi:hypothetical protein